jgi:hypothetical protein
MWMNATFYEAANFKVQLFVHEIFLEEEMNPKERGKAPKGERIPKSNPKKRGEKRLDPCMRCGAPVEQEGDLLCKKCDGEVH